MKIFFSIFTFCFIFFGKGFSQDQNISLTGLPDTEPYLAINPANSNNLIAAWMHMGINLKISIYTKTSFDGGTTWGNQTSLPHTFNGFTSADVSIAFNSAGEAFISYVDYKNTLPIPDSGYVCIAKSINGGNNWSAPVKAVSAADSPDLPVDRPWIVCDQSSSSSYKGKLYLVTKSYYASTPPQKVWLSISSDSGYTWTPIKQLDDSIPTGLTNIMGTPTVGSDGSLYVSYASYKPSLNPFARMICTKSTDGGNTFVPYDAMHYTSTSPCNDTLYQVSWSLSANPMNAANLILQFTDCRNGDMDILSVYSNDGAITWSSPIRVNNDIVGNGFGQDMLWGSFSSMGTYCVAWRDRRNYLTNDTSDFELYASGSADGGQTFPINTKLSNQKSPFVNIQRGNDFIGICVNNSSLFSDWCDMRTGNTEIFFNVVPLYNIIPIGVEEFPASDLRFKVFPNPTTKENVQYKIKSSKATEMHVKIFDAFGKEVYSKIVIEENGMLNANLSPGNYIVKLNFKKESLSVKLEIVK